MPLKDTHLIDFKHDRVELIAELLRTEDDDPSILQGEISQRIFDHQLELMTDPALLDQSELNAISSFISRDHVAPSVVQLLETMGLTAIEQEVSRRPQNSTWIGRFVGKKNNRAHLQKWSLQYLRAAELSPRLARLEYDLEQGDLGSDDQDMVDALQNACAKHMETRIFDADINGLVQLEQDLIHLRGNPGKPWILLASTVRCLTAFVAKAIGSQAIRTHWSEFDEEDQPLYVQSEHGPIVRTDPALRVVRFINSGTKALLSDYAKHVIRQSLTPNA